MVSLIWTDLGSQEGLMTGPKALETKSFVVHDGWLHHGHYWFDAAVHCSSITAQWACSRHDYTLDGVGEIDNGRTVGLLGIRPRELIGYLNSDALYDAAETQTQTRVRPFLHVLR